ncbi:MAG TPA: serine/threonine-protein kinase [Polyangiaceae bacterium]
MTAVALDVGDVVDGRYQLLRDLGRGAAGAVFEARHLFTGRVVAVKMVRPESGLADIAELRARLLWEGRALAAIRHPGVVEVLDGGVTRDGSPYVVMEMLQGRTLEGLITARTRLPVECSVAVALQLCAALDAVHRAGVIHRDVKPANMVVVKGVDGREAVRLVDFGIAKFEPSDAKVTSPCVILGSPAYMAPEHILQQGLEPDPTFDLYAVGVTLYECLTGSMPHPAETFPELVQSVTRGEPPSVRAIVPEIPPALAVVVARSIARSRADRYQTARELAGAIEKAMPGASRETTLLGPTRAPAGTPSGEQRRRDARAPYNTLVRLTMRDGRSLDGRTEDISESGLLVLSFAGCEPAQRVALRFALPLDGEIVALEGDVRWVRASDHHGSQGMRAIGLEFVQPPPETKTSIARYVQLMSGGECHAI